MRVWGLEPREHIASTRHWSLHSSYVTLRKTREAMQSPFSGQYLFLLILSCTGLALSHPLRNAPSQGILTRMLISIRRFATSVVLSISYGRRAQSLESEVVQANYDALLGARTAYWSI